MQEIVVEFVYLRQMKMKNVLSQPYSDRGALAKKLNNFKTVQAKTTHLSDYLKFIWEHMKSW